MSRVRYEVIPARPYSLARTAARFARYPECVDRFDGTTYRRLLFAGGKPLLLEVRQNGAPSRATLNVSLSGDHARRAEARETADRALEKVLGIRTDVRSFYRKFRRDPLLGPIIENHSGLRVAGRLTVWETLLQIVLSQQINLRFAHDVLTNLAERLGRRARLDGARFFSYPSSRRVARLDPTALMRFRLSRAKAETLVVLARAFEKKELSEEKLQQMNDEDAISVLTSFKGVGRWTAEFTLLRGLSRLDIFPGGDLGVVKYLARTLLGRDGNASEREMREFAERWRPFRGLALIYAYAELARRSDEGTR